MATHISWADEVWNPSIGCTRVSDGCDHCYAFALHDQRHIAWKRGRMPDAPAQYHQPFSKVQLLPDRLDAPLHWRKPRRVFVNSMSDLFHEQVSDAFIDRVFAVMALTPQHTYQVLTKRPARMQAYLLDEEIHRLGSNRVSDAAFSFPLWPDISETGFLQTGNWPLPNVWLGVSVENQRWASRIVDLLATPAAKHFVSLEPLLSGIDLAPWLWVDCPSECVSWSHQLAGRRARRGELDWVIVGGESGAQRRPMKLEWLTDIVAQCKAAGVPVFVKQSSALRPGQQGAIPDNVWALKQFPDQVVR